MITSGWTPAGAALLVLAGCPKPPPRPAANEPRLPAVEACAQDVALASTPLPVPPRPAADPYALPTAAAMFVVTPSGARAVTSMCDLPDRILGIAAEQGVLGGKRRIGGVVHTIERARLGTATGSGSASASASGSASIAIEPDSAGCRDGILTCAWTTRSALGTIETVPRQQVSTSGWVHGLDDLCRALPDDTIATCSTANRLAYVELGCQPADAPPVALQLGLHDPSLERRYDLDVEVPVARLYGAATSVAASSFVYAFTGPGDAKGRYKQATLAIDLAAKTAVLELDGTREPCVAFGLFRR